MEKSEELSIVKKTAKELLKEWIDAVKKVGELRPDADPEEFAKVNLAEENAWRKINQYEATHEEIIDAREQQIYRKEKENLISSSPEYAEILKEAAAENQMCAEIFKEIQGGVEIGLEAEDPELFKLWASRIEQKIKCQSEIGGRCLSLKDIIDESDQETTLIEKTGLVLWTSLCRPEWLKKELFPFEDGFHGYMATPDEIREALRDDWEKTNNLGLRDFGEERWNACVADLRKKKLIPSKVSTGQKIKGNKGREPKQY